MSAGPDFNKVILGSEGNLGVVCDATLRVRPIPETTNYGSLIFPNWECGVKFMEEMGK